MTVMTYASDITVNATPSSSIKGDNQFEVIGNSRLGNDNYTSTSHQLFHHFSNYIPYSTKV